MYCRLDKPTAVTIPDKKQKHENKQWLVNWTRLVIVKDKYSQLVYPNICIKKEICENLTHLVIKDARE